MIIYMCVCVCVAQCVSYMRPAEPSDAAAAPNITPLKEVSPYIYIYIHIYIYIYTYIQIVYARVSFTSAA